MFTIAGAVLALALQTTPAPGSLAEAYHAFLQGRTAESRGDIAGAVAAYKRAIALAPAASGPHAELAGVYARAGRATESIAEAEAALALDRTDREAHRILGLVQAALADNAPEGARRTQLTNDAIGHLEQALTGARDPGAELTLGRLTLGANRLARAIEVLRNFLYDNPGYPEGVMLLTEAFERNGQIAEAIATLEPEAGRGRLDAPEAVIALAELYERAGRWADAAARWGAAYQKSQDPEARMRQASAWLNAGQVTAGRDLAAAIATDRPRDPAALYLLAQAERRAGRTDAAEAAAKRLAELDPEDPRGPLALAEVFEARKDFPGVIRVLRPLFDARRAAPKPGDEVFRLTGLSLGNAYDILGQDVTAEEILRAVLARDGRDEVALNALAYLLANRGRRFDEALALANRALAIDPGNPAFSDTLGWIHVQQGRPADGVAALERAAAAAPKASLIQAHLGEAYLALKRYAEAAAAFGRALAGDGEGIDAATITRKRAQALALVR